MTTTKIERKIVGFKVETNAQNTSPQPVEMNESIERPEVLLGTTYKVKGGSSEHAMYITINDIVLNESTDHEVRRPYEIFINSKAMEHFQWSIALTRVISACFRKGGDATFLVEELLSVYDPNGGYWKKGGVFMPSLVAEIGSVIEKHMKAIGLIETEQVSEHTKAFLADKRAAFEAQDQSLSENQNEGFPSNATVCTKCHTKAVVLQAGCSVCLQCQHSVCSG